MDIYLDIDGVVLTRNSQPANNLKEFLEFAVTHHNTYWLTTHCKGESDTTLSFLRGKIPEELFVYLKQIKPTNWELLKTEAIDFNKDFIWLDDYVMEAEKAVLEKHKALKNLILINLVDNPNQLLYILKNEQVQRRTHELMQRDINAEEAMTVAIAELSQEELGMGANKTPKESK